MTDRPYNAYFITKNLSCCRFTMFEYKKVNINVSFINFEESLNFSFEKL